MASRRRLVLGVLGVALLGTCAYQCTSAERAGPPMWTEDDLPALPPSEDNGWQILQDRLQAGLEVPALPDDVEMIVASLDTNAPAETWTQLVEQRDAFGGFMAKVEDDRALVLWRRSMKAPAFADACPVEITGDCRHFGMFQLHRVAASEVLWWTVRDDAETALELTTTMIERQARYLRGARGPMGARVALAMLQESLGLGALLQYRIDEGAEVPEPALDAYRAALESIDLDRTILEQIVIGEYLLARDALAHVSKAEGTELLGDSFWPPRWLYDEGYAAARVDERYEAVIAVARDPAAPIPEPEEPGWTDRILHPVSTSLLMVLDPRMLLVGHVVDMRDELSAVESTRSALLRD